MPTEARRRGGRFGVVCAILAATLTTTAGSPLLPPVSAAAPVMPRGDKRSIGNGVPFVSRPAPRFGIAHTFPLEGRPTALVIDARRERAWIADELEPVLRVVDLRDGALVDSMEVSEPAVALAVDRDRLYIGLPIARQLAVIDLATHVALGAVDLDLEPRWLVPTEDAHVWVSGALARVARVDALALRAGSPLDVAVDELSCGIGLSPSRRRLYLCRRSEQLSAIDIDSFSVDGTLAIGNIPLDLDVNERTGRASIAISASGTVQVVDLDTFSLLAAGEVGEGASDVTSNPVDGTIAAIAPLDATAAIFDGRTNERVSLIDLPASPAAIAVDEGTGRFVVTLPEPAELLVLDDLGRRRRPPLTFEPPARRGLRFKPRGDASGGQAR